jgi:hypothetical protein
MNLPTIKRPLYREEAVLLKKIKTITMEEAQSKCPIKFFFVILLSGLAAAYLASIIKIGFLEFIFGTLAVVAGVAVVFVISPYHIYKERRKGKQAIKQIDDYLTHNELTVTPIAAIRIAVGDEYEDEGELFIIEYQPGWILYMWDNDYNLRKKLPCLKFEIYDAPFALLMGRMVFSLSPKIKPVRINSKAKWDYLGKYGPGHLQTEQIDFEDLLRRFDDVPTKAK